MSQEKRINKLREEARVIQRLLDQGMCSNTLHMAILSEGLRQIKEAVSLIDLENAVDEFFKRS